MDINRRNVILAALSGIGLFVAKPVAEGVAGSFLPAIDVSSIKLPHGIHVQIQTIGDVLAQQQHWNGRLTQSEVIRVLAGIGSEDAYIVQLTPIADEVAEIAVVQEGNEAEILSRSIVEKSARFRLSDTTHFQIVLGNVT